MSKYFKFVTKYIWMYLLMFRMLVSETLLSLKITRFTQISLNGITEIGFVDIVLNSRTFIHYVNISRTTKNTTDN